MIKFKNFLKATMVAGCCISLTMALTTPTEPTRGAPDKAPTSNYLRNCYFDDGTTSWKAADNSNITAVTYGKDEKAITIYPTSSSVNKTGVSQVVYSKNSAVLNLSPMDISAFTSLYATKKVNAEFVLTIWSTPTESDDYTFAPKEFDAGAISELNGKISINKSYSDVYKVELKLNFLKPVSETDMASVSIDNIGLELYNDYIHACGRHLRKGSEPIYLEAICFSNTYDRYVYGQEYEGEDFDLLTSRHHKPTEAFRKITGTGIEGINKKHVRFSFNANWFPDDIKSPGDHNVWKWLDSNVNEATRAGVYLLLDMHCAPGYEWLSGKWVNKEGANSSHWIWGDSDKKDKMVDIWREIALRYKDNPYIAGYQILTEPILSSESDVNEWIGQDTSLAERCINAIRENDKKHMVMVDLVNGNAKNGKLSYGISEGVDPFTNLSNGESNAIRHRAFYSPFTFSHQYATWLHRGLMFDRNKWPNGETKDTMPEILGNVMGFYGNKNRVYSMRTNELSSNMVGSYEWVESGEYTIDEISEIKLGTVLLSVNGVMPSNSEAYFDTIEIVETTPLGVTSVLRRRAITSDYTDPYPENGVSPILDYRAYGPLCSSDLTLNGNPANTDDKEVDNLFQLGSYYDALWKTKYVLAIKTNYNTLNGSYYGWFSNNNRFIPKPGHTYKIRARIKVNNENIRANTKAELFFFKDVDNQLIKRNKNYLKSYLNSIAASAKNNNIPMAIFEFGAMWQCFEEDALNGGNMGGAQWVEDMITVLRNKNIHWAYWSYHNEFMGLYPTNDWDIYPNENDIIKPLADILRTK